MTKFSETKGWPELKSIPGLMTRITVLKLLGCPLSGKVIHDILCEMPNLETFESRCLSNKDLDGRPWVCERLRVLTLDLLLDPSVSLSLRDFLSRLSRLKRLERLNIEE